MRNQSKWDTFWRWFNPPLPDVMQAEMLRRVRGQWKSTLSPLFACSPSDEQVRKLLMRNGRPAFFGYSYMATK